MEDDNNEGRADGPTPGREVHYTLETYRDDRVKANIRRLAMERTAAGAENLAVVPGSTSAASPRRRAVLRETSMPSAFEYVNYNMPETVPQEVVQRRQVGRDLADPGISSGGPRLTDIVHQPPRHATLSPPVVVQRSSRGLLLSRDRAMEADENLAPLPRPYVPRGLIDAFCEPYQHDRGRSKRLTLQAEIRSGGADIRQASRDLQKNLATATADTIPKSMDLAEVQAAADALVASDTDLNIGRNQILATLQGLQQNWYPNEFVLGATRIYRPVLTLRNYPNEEVAQLAKDLITEWRETIRVADGRRPTVAGEDPFVDEETENYGGTISRQAWDNTIRDRQTAARDFNNAASAETRAADQRRRREVQRQRQDREDEDLRLHMQRIRSNAKTDPDSNVAGADSEGGDALEIGRHANSTITDPNADPGLTGNQNFEIAEVDPSPERPQRGAGINVLQQRPEDTPVQSIEQDGPAGLCHECPDFPYTYHHICVGNPQCDILRARVRPTRQRTSPSYGPSQSPQPAGPTADERARAGREALARLAETARSTGVNRPVANPANVPEGMADPFTTSGLNTGLGLKKLDGNVGEGTDEVSPSKGRMPQAQRMTTPTVQTTPALGSSRTGNGQARMPPRPTYAEYAAASPTQLLYELQGRQSPPVSGAGISKDRMIRTLMLLDLVGDRGYGAPPPSSLNTGVVRNGRQGGNRVSPLDLDFSEFTGHVEGAARSASAPSSRKGPRPGTKRPSPTSRDESSLKRLRSSNGMRRSA